ncbi:chitin synthase [Pilobolus umbonatus]|nr:chitin synthase [Pilobolus umbonatus]
MGFVGFLTFGFTQVTCPPPNTLSINGNSVPPGYLLIHGWAFLLSDWDGHPMSSGFSNVIYSSQDMSGMDASLLFPQKFPECDNVFIPLQGPQNRYFPCQVFNSNNTVFPDASQFTNTSSCHTSSRASEQLSQLTNQGVPTVSGRLEQKSNIYYDYDHVQESSHLMIYNGNVLNLQLLQSLPRTYYTVSPDGLVDQLIRNMSHYAGKDMTYTIKGRKPVGLLWEQEAECLSKTIRIGQVDSISVGCMLSNIVLYISLVVILGVIISKFVLAVIFGWFLSWKLGSFKEGQSYSARMKRDKQIENWAKNINIAGPVMNNSNPSSVSYAMKRRSIFPNSSRFTPLEHGSTRFGFNKSQVPVWKLPNDSKTTSYASRNSSVLNTSKPYASTAAFPASHPPRFSWDGHIADPEIVNRSVCPFPLSPNVVPQPAMDYMPFNYPLAHTICLVTCYSEGEQGIRTTLDSICMSDYPKSHTLLLVICDGLIKGSGETMSTPDICVGMMRDLITPADEVQSQPYIAIADGSRRNNYAKVYAGYYRFDNETIPEEAQLRVPMITIVKCGSPEEQDQPKPGNRGKRDSQIILMQFLQKVMFDERMTMMEYEFFNSIWRVSGVSPDCYEICLMVDADTKLYPDALSRLISAAVKDPEISGLCGETKIANKMDSWVSMIQVFEYYISHHQSKAFESIFGAVTCLPGCFCMYRIKAPKGPNGYWVPILANPDIVQHYSENIVDTLHRKNLLLLGEDRYLSTLMLRTFPHRKMMFVPQAVCKTVVPDTFKVLLSQRRRWINSTIHNLFELVLVHDLCGTFCFSMQFVVFMELVGTLALPAAISFTLYLVILACLGQPAIVPLILLALILGLPAVLILMTSRKVVYVCWMLIYLISLPIWNFVLPTYAYWHFDDFSWGDTRKVEGIKKDKGHGHEGGEFDSSVITMKKWSEYEIDRRIKIAKDRNLPIPHFIERNYSVDVFRNTNNISYEDRIKKYRHLSDDSGNIPLTAGMDQGDLSTESLSPLDVLSKTGVYNSARNTSASRTSAAYAMDDLEESMQTVPIIIDYSDPIRDEK